MIMPIITKPAGHRILTRVPDLNTYTSVELNAHRLPVGNPYQDKLGQDPIFDLRHKAWLECSLATVMNRASAEEVCWHWSKIADQVIQEIFLKYCKAEDLAVFAMGKLGSQELNLSSDIDLLFVAREYSNEILKQVRDFQQAISQITALGFLFRCDLDLRPGGKTSPLAPTVDQMMDYYGNYGETWERIAFVRCRYVTGSQNIKSQLEPFLKRFIYRKHLDYSLFEDLKGLREKIQKAVRTQDGQINLKLVPGGIRDIELFINSLQVIHGGKNPKLQLTNTTLAFDQLESEKILPLQEILFFKNFYWRLRFLENYVQAQEDQQTHSIQKSGTFPKDIAKALENLEKDLVTSSLMVSGLLGSIEVTAAADLEIEFQQLLEIPLLSRQKDRDQKTRQVFVQNFSQALNKTTGDRPLAISFLKEFINAVRAKSGLFSLLARETKLAEDLAWLFGHSPYLSQILCQRPELLDSFVYRNQDLQHQEIDLLLEQLLEKRLLTEIIQGTDFFKTQNILAVLKNLTSVADEIVTELVKATGAEELKILALGKWGGQELGFQSDLDFIFVLDQEPQEKHFKLARRIISRLTEPHKGGSLYAIDMRLKPSGKAGPLIVSYEELLNYLRNSSEPWERQAYLRSRGILWDAHEIRQACYAREIDEESMKQLRHVRQQLIKPTELDLKYSEGGLLDLELFSQTYLLKNKLFFKGAPSTIEMLQMIPGAERFVRNYSELRLKEQFLHLISAAGESDLSRKADSIQVFAALFKKTPEELKKDILDLFSENTKLLNELDPRRTTG